MLKNRLLIAFLIIISGVFVTFYGGPVTYTLFFLCLFLPITSLLYLVYVYYRFRIYQLIDHKTIMKGETVPYRFILANEDFVSYTSVNNSFYSDLSHVTELDSNKDYNLVPGDKIEKNGSIICNYRGEYKVGIDRVEIHDFLGIYSLNYSCPTPIEVRVLPRVLALSTLSIAPPEEDDKLQSMLRNSHDIPDVSVREYTPGDSLRTIHWKSSARTGKLQTRKYFEEAKPTLSIFLDLTQPCEDKVRRIIITDTVIECTLAIVNYFVIHGTQCKLIADMSRGIKVNDIYTKADFNNFYNFCTDVSFHSKINFDELIALGLQTIKSTGYCFLITCSADSRLAGACQVALDSGNQVTVLLISEEPVEIPHYFDNRIVFRRITVNDDIISLLS